MKGVHGNDADSHHFVLSIVILNFLKASAAQDSGIKRQFQFSYQIQKGRREASFFLFSRGTKYPQNITRQGSLGHSNKIL